MIADSVFDLVMANSPNLVFIKDENSVILYANQAFLSVYPPERREGIVGTTTVEAFSEAEAALFLAEDQRALSSGTSEMVEEIVDYTGYRRVFLTRKTAFRTDAGEPRLLGISTDITELSERESALVRTNHQLERFCAMAARDLRSPLATIVSALNVVKRDARSISVATFRNGTRTACRPSRS